MADQFAIWLDAKDNSVEGHTLNGILTFNNKVIWGPKGCHENTENLRKALNKADHRFDMILVPKEKSVEGHTRYISIRDSNGNLVLDKLSTHNNMEGLVAAVNAARIVG
ncbi:hypothetical protein NOR_00232 [Metarhizium rileyi]|uniref:Uncharacterized protein n=1 Tax=Metarhizium rileyi (strain RCEF 4871) TaxID=1649241 RepID=A0A167KEW7_METRR|nr:hypothetical protein NOR_00232 [Metarhizium rileyi RCEF 4871]